MKFLSYFYKKRQASCVELFNNVPFSFKFLDLTSPDLKALYILKHRAYLNGNDGNFANLSAGSRTFVRRADILRKFKYRSRSLRALFRSKLSLLSFRDPLFAASSFGYRASVLKVLLRLANALSSRFFFLNDGGFSGLTLRSGRIFGLNSKVGRIHEFFCALRTLVGGVDLNQTTSFRSSMYNVLLSNLWANRLTFFDSSLPFINSTSAVSYLGLGTSNCTSIRGQSSSTPKLVNDVSNVVKFAQGILLSVSPVRAGPANGVFSFSNLLNIILSGDSRLELYRLVSSFFDFQTGFVRNFATGYFYSSMSKVRGALFDAFMTNLRGVLYTLGLRWRTMNVLDSVRVIPQLSIFANHLSYNPFVISPSSLRTAFLLKRRYTALMFNGFSSELVRTHNLRISTATSATSSLQVRTNLLRGNLRFLSLYPAKNVGRLICNFFLKTRREINKRIRFARYRLLKSEKSKVGGLSKP